MYILALDELDAVNCLLKSFSSIRETGTRTELPTTGGSSSKTFTDELHKENEQRPLYLLIHNMIDSLHRSFNHSAQAASLSSVRCWIHPLLLSFLGKLLFTTHFVAANAVALQPCLGSLLQTSRDT